MQYIKIYERMKLQQKSCVLYIYKTNTKMKAYENIVPTNNEDKFNTLIKQQT